MHNLGTAYYLRGQYGRGYPYFKRAFELEPEGSLSGYLAAECAASEGRLSESRRLLAEVLRYNPRYEYARWTLRTGRFVVW
jgi:tetratricopeptide (TPR) repeat protein